MMNWIAEISGEANDLDRLMDADTDELFHLEKIESQYFLKFEKHMFPDLNSFSLKVKEALMLARGILCLIHGYVGEISVIRVMKEDSKNSGSFTSIHPLRIVSRPDWLLQGNDGVVRDYAPNDYGRWIFELGIGRSEVSEVLKLLSISTSSFVELYKIYEIIRKDVGGLRQLQKMNWVNKTDLNRFSRSANNPEVSGRESRHAVSNDMPPQKPMPIDEAYTFISSLVRQWIILKS